MLEIVFVYLVMSIGMSIFAIKEDRLLKNISKGYNPNAKDRDGDGIVQEGTKWERKIKK